MKSRSLYRLLVAPLLLTTSCYLVSPDVSLRHSFGPTWYDPTAPSIEVPNTPSSVENHNSYTQYSIKYAENAHDEYLRAKGEYSTLPGALGTALIPVGGAALALGIEGESTAAVTGLGVGAATLLGMGTFYQHKDRETVYMTGADAVECLLTNMQPYTDVSTDNLTTLQKKLYGPDVPNLSGVQADLELSFAEYSAMGTFKDCTRSKSDRDMASALLKAAQAAIKSGQTARQVAGDYLGIAIAAPNAIVYSVDQINDNVSTALIATEPDVQTLAANMKGVIPSTANNLAGIQSVKPAASPPAAAAASSWRRGRSSSGCYT